MKLTENVITEAEAIKINPDYVKFAKGDFKQLRKILTAFESIKRRGQKVLTYDSGQFVIAKVSSINANDPRAEDGPVVRVSNGEYSWRVDGNKYAVAI